MSRIYTFEDAKQIIAELSDCKVLSETGEFKGVTSKLRLQCSCGNEFLTDLHHFKSQNQRQCPECGRRSTTAKNQVPFEDVLARLRRIGCDYVSGEYANRRSKLTIRCTCGHLRTISMNSVFYAKKPFTGLCAKCSVRKQHDRTRMDVEDVRILLAAKGLILLSGEYENARTPLTLKCSCGQEFQSCYDLLSSGAKRPCCRVCSNRISSGEKAIADWLTEHNINYEREKTFPGCRVGSKPFRFDFYLPMQNLCIEYDGQGHFQIINYSGKESEDRLTRILWDTQERDFLKEQFCAENGIDILRISYEEFNQIPQILSDKLIPR